MQNMLSTKLKVSLIFRKHDFLWMPNRAEVVHLEMANSQLSSQLHAALNSHSWAAQFSSGFGAGSRGGPSGPIGCAGCSMWRLPTSTTPQSIYLNCRDQVRTAS